MQLTQVFRSTVALVTLGATTAGIGSGVGTSKIFVDGSLATYPIGQAMAEDFMMTHPSTQITVASGGSGGSMKAFIEGVADICQTNRPISLQERTAAKRAGVGYIEIPIAFQVLSVIVNKKNTFANTLTLRELQKIWMAGSKVNNWNQVRRGFPNLRMTLCGPNSEESSINFFNDAVVQRKAGIRRPSYASDDENVAITAVMMEKGGLGYVAYGHYFENRSAVRAVRLGAGRGAIAPSPATFVNGTYVLSRPLFIYVRKTSLRKPDLKAFVESYIDAAGVNTIQDTGFVALPQKAYDLNRKHLRTISTGSRFQRFRPGMDLVDLLGRSGSH